MQKLDLILSPDVSVIWTTVETTRAREARALVEDFIDRLSGIEVRKSAAIEFKPNLIGYYGVDERGRPTLYLHPWHFRTLQLRNAVLPPDEPAPMDGPPVEGRNDG